MQAILTSWDVTQHGPAFNTRLEHADGSVSFEGLHEVRLTFTVIGNNAMEFIDAIRQLEKGAKINRIDIETKKRGGVRQGRKYVFE